MTPKFIINFYPRFIDKKSISRIFAAREPSLVEIPRVFIYDCFDMQQINRFETIGTYSIDEVVRENNKLVTVEVTMNEYDPELVSLEGSYFIKHFLILIMGNANT
eukprot:328428_1